MNDRHRIKLTCEDGCGASLWLRLDGTRDAELHRDRLRRTLAAIAEADGWQAGRCPACVRWGTVAPARTYADGTKKSDSAPIDNEQEAYDLGYRNRAASPNRWTWAHAVYTNAFTCGQADAQNEAPRNPDYRCEDYDPQTFERLPPPAGLRCGRAIPARDVPCPDCLAVPGRPCVDPDGVPEPRGGVHIGRAMAADRAVR